MSSLRYCPECRAEYVGSARECVECGVALVGEAELSQRAGESLPPVSQLVCVRAASLGWARALSGMLAEEGVSHRIEVAADDLEEGGVGRPGANLPYGVYVRPEDVAIAARVDAAFMRSQIPDLPGEGEAGEEEVGSCPACGASLGGADECPDCGLVLGSGDG